MAILLQELYDIGNLLFLQFAYPICQDIWYSLLILFFRVLNIHSHAHTHKTILFIRFASWLRRYQISLNLMMTRRRLWNTAFPLGRYIINLHLSTHPSLSMSQVLNGLEQMGYRVVTSSCMVTGFTKHDTRDFIWTMHKAKEDWEASSMWRTLFVKIFQPLM